MTELGAVISMLSCRLLLSPIVILTLG